VFWVSGLSVQAFISRWIFSNISSWVWGFGDLGVSGLGVQGLISLCFLLEHLDLGFSFWFSASRVPGADC